MTFLVMYALGEICARMSGNKWALLYSKLNVHIISLAGTKISALFQVTNLIIKKISV